jgi:hypothetical protein
MKLPGIDYVSRRTYNELQEVEYCAGELDEEEYLRDCWRARDVQLPAGGRVFEARVAGTGYVC